MARVLLFLSAIASPAGTASVCNYTADNGIYLSTYGSLMQKAIVSQAALSQLDIALAFPYVKGVAHYQNWSTLEVADGVFNWTVIDAVFDIARKHGKYVILGLQQGVAAPYWLLNGASSYGIPVVDFVHANPGWWHWSTLQRYSEGGQKVSTMAVPWDATYETYVRRAVSAMAARYAHNPALAYVNVCGPSSSGGVEANFVVNYEASREVNRLYDVQMNFTLDKYVAAWKRRIDWYLPLFNRVGMATHNSPGSEGWDAGAEHVVNYSSEVQLDAARAIKNYLIQNHAKVRQGSRAVLRCCGGSNNTHEWGVPNTTADKPPNSTYAVLMWESRQVADIGFEPATVESIFPGGGSSTAEGVQRMLDIDLYYNGRFLEIKRPDLIDNANQPYQQYAPVFAAAAAYMRSGRPLPFNCSNLSVNRK